MLKATKFGGSSVAGADQFRKIKAIIDSDEARRIVVSSAAGKRDKGATISSRTSCTSATHI